MSEKKEKHLDLELLVFYLSVSLISFFLYIIRHPLISIVKVDKVNTIALFSAYSLDLIIFLLVLVPYLSIIIALIVRKIVKKKIIADNIMVVLFFPLLSFFTKGMSIFHIYVEYGIIKILRNNFPFFSFLFIGPTIIIIHKIVMYIKGQNEDSGI